MALKIRLRPQGRVHRRFFRVVVTDSHQPRNGRYVEALGWYNPFEEEEDRNLFLKEERLQHWVGQGAVMTENVEALVARGAQFVVKSKREKEAARREKIAAKKKAHKQSRQSKSDE
ncbi:MAG: 30S ribosomal protein S16 [Waddliaceae bacterium]